MDVKKTTKGPQVYLSRSHPGLVKRLFELEVPEIQDGVVEIKSIAREAGSRTKIAVYSEDENVDPVGACVGARGVRVQAVVDELFDEKNRYYKLERKAGRNDNQCSFSGQGGKGLINEDEKSATVVVPDYQLSRHQEEGRTVRLAAKLSRLENRYKESHASIFPSTLMANQTRRKY